MTRLVCLRSGPLSNFERIEQIKWEPDYEPYVVVRRDVTRYDRYRIYFEFFPFCFSADAIYHHQQAFPGLWLEQSVPPDGAGGPKIRFHRPTQRFHRSFVRKFININDLKVKIIFFSRPHSPSLDIAKFRSSAQYRK